MPTRSKCPGTYELSVNVPGMKSFRRGGYAVAVGQTLRLEQRLLQIGPSSIDALVFMVENATGFTHGHSVGKWEGDTLVIDAIGFRDRGWLNFGGQPHSDRLHVIERMRRPDLGHLEIEVTLDDPGAFQKKWTGTLCATLAPDIELQEFVCTENNKDPVDILGR